MEKVRVNASKSYDILIGRDLLSNMGELILPFLKTDTVVLISDDKVFSLYGEKVINSLKHKGVFCQVFVFENGEKSKNSDTYIRILNFMAEKKICRNDLIIALGGGVVGDMAGFVAATYLRGISFVQIPTTLLAAVDSSVGGKTGIDLDLGKNLVGAFYQPSLVLCDCDTLKTLDEKNFKSGMAEVIKYAFIKDKELYDYLCSEKLDLEHIIKVCTTIKSEIVNADEFDTGIRQILNFGHTFGHAIEIDSNFTITHGYAVAVGMCFMTECAKKQGFISDIEADKMINLVKKTGLPVFYDISAKRLEELILSDKKVMGKTINMIVPEQIGKCKIYPVLVEDIHKFIKGEKINEG